MEEIYKTITLKATVPQRIRVGNEKRNVKKWEIIKAYKDDFLFYKQYGFIEVKMEDEVKTETKKVKSRKKKNTK